MSNQLIRSRELTMTYNPKTECFQGYDFKVPKYFVDQKTVPRLSKIIKKKPKNILLSLFNKNQYNDGFVKNGKIYLKPRKKLNKNRKNKIYPLESYVTYMSHRNLQGAPTESSENLTRGQIPLRIRKDNYRHKTNKTNKTNKTDKTNEINIFRTINKKLTKKNNGFRFARDNLKKTKKYFKNLKGRLKGK